MLEMIVRFVLSYQYILLVPVYNIFLIMKVYILDLSLHACQSLHACFS